MVLYYYESLLYIYSISTKIEYSKKLHCKDFILKKIVFNGNETSQLINSCTSVCKIIILIRQLT